MTTNAAWQGAVVFSLLCALTGLLRRWPHLAGTTVRALCGWHLAAIISLGLVAGTNAANGSADWLSHALYLGAISTLCPVVALLGAKRPQDGAWQFVVLSFWAVAALPSLQQWFSRPHATLELHGAWQWFLVVLVAIGLLNHLFTRHWPSAVLMAVGQVCLLAMHVPGLAGIVGSKMAIVWQIGAICWSCGLSIWGWNLPPRRVAATAPDRLWLDFRDLLGTLWALRVAERVNAAARQSGWSARLTWRGWTSDTQFSPVQERSMRMLLRRFVSQQWIDRRLNAEHGIESSTSRSTGPLKDR